MCFSTSVRKNETQTRHNEGFKECMYKEKYGSEFSVAFYSLGDNSASGLYD